jgi:hypothetical protein
MRIIRYYVQKFWKATENTKRYCGKNKKRPGNHNWDLRKCEYPILHLLDMICSHGGIVKLTCATLKWLKKEVTKTKNLNIKSYWKLWMGWL